MRRLAFLVTLSLIPACSHTSSPIAPTPFVAAAATLGAQAAAAPVVSWSAIISARTDQPGATGPDVPSAPSNVAFTVSGSTVILTWSAPGSGAATSYVVEAGSASGMSNIAAFDTGSSATTITATSVPAGTYYVRLRARNADGFSSPSNEVTIVVSAAPCLAPAAPTALTATVTGNAITLSWTGVAGALGYIIEAGSAAGTANLANFDTRSAATSFVATAPNGTYYVRVRVRTACGTSTVSNEVVVTIGASAPANLSGRWSQTDPQGRTQTVDFTHSGSSLTGTFVGYPATFNLTQTGASGTTLTFSGNLVISVGGPCSPATFPGTMQADTSTNTMNGTFTGRNTDCLNEVNEFHLRKQ